MHNRKQSQSGQIAVIVLLLMVVMLTIGLSLASRTTQDLFLSNQQADSTRVFNAAESGIEEALLAIETGGSLSNSLTIGDSNVTYQINEDSQINTNLEEGKSLHVNTNGPGWQVEIRWGDKSIADCDDQSSLMITEYYDESGVTKAKFTPVGCDRGDNSRFQPPTTDLEYKYRYNYMATPNSKFLRIKALYNDTSISVKGPAGFPTQSYVINSEAINQTGSENETRKIQVKRTLSTAPSFMEYALYSPGSISK